MSLWPVFLIVAGQLTDHTSRTIQHPELSGYWDVLDPASGVLKFTAEFYKYKGLYHARVVHLHPEAPLKTCLDCPEPFKNKPLEGMDIIWGLKQEAGEWTGGKILNPEGGKIYDCDVWLEPDQSLVVRGYLKMRVFGKSQKWIKRKS